MVGASVDDGNMVRDDTAFGCWISLGLAIAVANHPLRNPADMEARAMTGWHYQTENGTWEPCGAWLADQIRENHNPDPGYEFAPVMWINYMTPSTASVARAMVELSTPVDGNTKGGE